MEVNLSLISVTPRAVARGARTVKIALSMVPAESVEAVSATTARYSPIDASENVDSYSPVVELRSSGGTATGVPAGSYTLKVGAPSDYGDAFRRLAAAGHLAPALAARLVKAAGFRNVLAHPYETLDMPRVYDAAWKGPPDLLAFLALLSDRAAAWGEAEHR